MKTGTITILGAATVLVAAGAWYASTSRAAGNTAIPRDTPLLPALQEAINDVASVAVTTADGTVTLERGEGGWTLAEKAGYAARADRVRTLLFELRDARVLEQKTANPDRFTRLGLDRTGRRGLERPPHRGPLDLRRDPLRSPRRRPALLPGRLRAGPADPGRADLRAPGG